MSDYMPDRMPIVSGRAAGALTWRKSSYSGAGNDCVEVAEQCLRTLVRDSKAPGSGRLAFGARSWHAFLTGTR